MDCFKVQFGDIVIAVNPISKDSKFKSTRFGSDITLVSLDSPDHNGADGTSKADKASFLINGPGEYEISGVFIKGYLSKSNYLGKESLNTIYTVNLEGINLCFLGAISDTHIVAETKEAIDGIDILFAPIGGEGVLEASTAHKLAVQFEPKLIIPSHFTGPSDRAEHATGQGIGGKNALKNFLKESGAENVKPVEKLTIKKKDLEGMEDEIVVLEAL